MCIAVARITSKQISSKQRINMTRRCTPRAAGAEFKRGSSAKSEPEGDVQAASSMDAAGC
jgi:hypothetical protein